MTRTIPSITRKHAGETMKNSANAPGSAAVALGVVAFVAAVGAVWSFVAHRRVRRGELRHAAREPGADAPPPTS